MVRRLRRAAEQAGADISLPYPIQILVLKSHCLKLPQEVVREVVRRLGRAAEQAAAYKDLTGPEWGPKVGAWLCAAHFLEHHLREGPTPLLLLDLQVTSTERVAQVGTK